MSTVPAPTQLFTLAVWTKCCLGVMRKSFIKLACDVFQDYTRMQWVVIKLMLHAIWDYYLSLLSFQIYEVIESDEMKLKETLQKVKQALESNPKDHIGNVIELAWKFVTLPNPLIVCQPKNFDHKIHDQEFGYWDKDVKEGELLYIRPVVYRNYEGVLASRGWVANTPASQQTSWIPKQCCLSQGYKLQLDNVFLTYY